MLEEEMSRRTGAMVCEEIHQADAAVEDLSGGSQRRPDGIYRREGDNKLVWMCSSLDQRTHPEFNGRRVGPLFVLARS
jgi:hypothetical protein